MVSQQESPPNPTSSMVHQFLISDSITGQSEYGNHQNINASYGSDLRGSTGYPHSIGLLPTIHSLGERMSASINLVQPPESEMSHTRHLMDLLGAASEQAHHRLSLSLGSQMFNPDGQYRQRAFNPDFISPSYLVAGDQEQREACNNPNGYSFSHGGFASSSGAIGRYGTPPFAPAIGNSRYLKPAQCLLQELVSVSDKAVEMSNDKYAGKLLRSVGGRRGAPGISSEIKAELYSCGVLPPSEENELQVKLAKLIALLEEVENRYERYYHQMEAVVSSFEEIAGLEAAKLYTAQALQAMSRHFCSLADGILSQIYSTRRKLSADFPKLGSGLAQLSLFDREGRQNRMSLQQLGFLQSQRQAWRPIRGLPETSVAILRAWLFEHFLHPYPNDPEKLLLSSQTGLTKNQVSNWFINARVRLWKPMIEEMYKEEFADSSEESNPLFLDTNSLTREDATDNLED